jgi:hypothetical protein
MRKINGDKMKKNIQWIQRYSNFKKTLNDLNEPSEPSSKRELSKLENFVIIHTFEYTYKLTWNTVRNFYRSKGEVDIHGSRDAFHLDFERGRIEDEKPLMKVVETYQMINYTFSEETITEITNHYASIFQVLAERLGKEKCKQSTGTGLFATPLNTNIFCV